MKYSNVLFHFSPYSYKKYLSFLNANIEKYFLGLQFDLMKMSSSRNYLFSPKSRHAWVQ